MCECEHKSFRLSVSRRLITVDLQSIRERLISLWACKVKPGLHHSNLTRHKRGRGHIPQMTGSATQICSKGVTLCLAEERNHGAQASELGTGAMLSIDAYHMFNFVKVREAEIYCLPWAVIPRAVVLCQRYLSDYVSGQIQDQILWLRWLVERRTNRHETDAANENRCGGTLPIQIDQLVFCTTIAEEWLGSWCNEALGGEDSVTSLYGMVSPYVLIRCWIWCAYWGDMGTGEVTTRGKFGRLMWNEYPQ